MTKSARYSTFKEPPIPGSWTTGNIAQRFVSNWLLTCCCGCCYMGQKTASTSGSNEEKISKSTVESQIPSNNSAKSGNGIELVMEEIPLADEDHEASKNETRDVTEDDAFLMNDKNDSSADISDSKSSGMRRVIDSLPMLPRKEKKSSSFNDDKNVSESDSEIGHPASLFAKCSKRHRQQRAINIPQLIIS